LAGCSTEAFDHMNHRFKHRLLFTRATSNHARTFVLDEGCGSLTTQTILDAVECAGKHAALWDVRTPVKSHKVVFFHTDRSMLERRRDKNVSTNDLGRGL
jgi:hypothetical protein